MTTNTKENNYMKDNNFHNQDYTKDTYFKPRIIQAQSLALNRCVEYNLNYGNLTYDSCMVELAQELIAAYGNLFYFITGNGFDKRLRFVADILKYNLGVDIEIFRDHVVFNIVNKNGGIIRKNFFYRYEYCIMDTVRNIGKLMNYVENGKVDGKLEN